MHLTHATKPAPANLAPKATQAKLRVSSPTDSDELAAEAVAGKVMRMAAPGAANDCRCGGTCADCAGGGHHDEKRHTSRAHHGGSHPTLAPPIVHEVLHSPGHSLDQATRAFMEPRFGHDFSRVRIHTDSQAAASARAVHAKAYTVGHDIVFAAGQFDTGSRAGKTLLAHELAHVTQRDGNLLHRSADFDVKTIDADLQANIKIPIPTVFTQASQTIDLAWTFLKYHNNPSGEIGKAADYPTTLDPNIDKTQKLDKTKYPKADATVPLSNTPVTAQFFAAPLAGKPRAMVLGGFHGDEYGGWQVTDELIKQLSAPGGTNQLGFNTIVVPYVNAGGVADQQGKVRMWRNRCNRQLVDLNRNFPSVMTSAEPDCPNTLNAPQQPEVTAVINLITAFKPERILSTHAIGELKQGGIYADPNWNPDAIALARGMASTVVNPRTDIPNNKLGAGKGDFNPVYPKDPKGKLPQVASLGNWAPDNARPGKTTSVITMEAQDFNELPHGQGTDPRTVEGYLRPVRAFLTDPATLDTQADRDILNDIQSFKAADRIGLLTGRLSQGEDIYRRIRFRIDTAVARLNAMGPPKTITLLSNYRAFSGTAPKNNAQIVFEKFFFTGGQVTAWDTIPDQYYKNGNKSKGFDRAAWLNLPSKERLDVILKFSALPGTSRHHWGTDVDFNSVKNADWAPGGTYAPLGDWLQKNASAAHMVQSYTPGRTGGYGEEPWHYSYAPISLGLRAMYDKEVKLQQDVIDPLVADFTARAAAAHEKLPADFAQALTQINIPPFIDDIAPGL